MLPSTTSAPSAFTWSGYIAFTVAAVPTGMKAGVRMTPRGMRISPVRAAPSVFETVKVNCSVLMKVPPSGPEQQARIAVRIEAIPLLIAWP